MFCSFIPNVEHGQLLPADPMKRGKMSIRYIRDLISSGVETGTLCCWRRDLSHSTCSELYEVPGHQTLKLQGDCAEKNKEAEAILSYVKSCFECLKCEQLV